MIALATINVGNTNEIPDELRAALSYDSVAKRIYSEAEGMPTEELDFQPETIEEAEQYIHDSYANQPVWDLQWIER